MIGLTGKQQLTALDVVRRRALDEYATPDRAQEDDALCEAQVKKVVEWLKNEVLEDCHEGYSNVMCFHRRALKALLEEVKE